MTLTEITSQAQHATVFVQANRNLGNFHVPVKAHLARTAVCPVSQSPDARPRPGPHIGWTMGTQPVRYFLLFSFSFFSLCPIKASCLPPLSAVFHKELALFMKC